MNSQFPVPQAGSTAGPAFCISNNVPYLAWKGESSNGTSTDFASSAIWCIRATNNTPDPVTGQYTWINRRQIPSVQTSDAPALASFNNQLYIAWEGAGGDSTIYFSRLIDYGNNDWTPQAATGCNSSYSPALAGNANGLYMAYKGVDASDTRLFLAHCADGKTWSAPQPLVCAGTQVGTSMPPSITAYGNTLYMVWVGESDNNIWWSESNDGTTWTKQQIVPQAVTSASPNILCDSNGSLWLAFKGLNDTKIYFSNLLSASNNTWRNTMPRYQAETQNRPAMITVAGGNSGMMMAWRGGTTDDIWYGPLLYVPDIGLSMQYQEMDNWCWIAVATSIVHYFNPGSAWTQSELITAQLLHNNQMTGTCVPTQGQINAVPGLAAQLADPYQSAANLCLDNAGLQAVCNHSGGINDAFDRASQKYQSVTLDLNDINTQMNLKQPIAVCLNWNDSSNSHYVAIGGVWEDLLLILDPDLGTSIVYFEDFPSKYSSGATASNILATSAH